jgi:hypothetical protein
LAIENETLVADMLEWIDSQPRTYAETMDAWRTSCPRLAIWEDAVHAGFVARAYRPGSDPVVNLTCSGREFLKAKRPADR